jgi:hypothetical protein
MCGKMMMNGKKKKNYTHYPSTLVVIEWLPVHYLVWPRMDYLVLKKCALEYPRRERS